MRSLVFALFATAAAAGLSPMDAQVAGGRDAAIAEGVDVAWDVVYAERGGRRLAMDIFAPEGERLRRPAIVLIHGQIPADRGRDHYTDLAGQLAAAGFVAATVDYRGARDAPYPAAIEDALDAVRFLRSHAAEYGLNPNAIGALGENFGGYLAAMLGLTDRAPAQAVQGPAPDASPSVRAVAAIHAPLDLPAFAASVTFPWYFQVFLGFPSRQSPRLWEEASPITHVGPHASAFLLAHGPEDARVPLEQSLRMRDALAAAGVRVVWHSPAGAGNGFADGITPPQLGALVRFFGETLDVPPEGVRLVEGVVYAAPEGRDLLLDVFVPEAAGGPRPGVVFVHGGGWAFGSRRDLRVLAAKLASRGFVTASIDYRLSGERIYPAAVDDAKAAVRWMRANAGAYGIDPDRIGAVGSSAGGHLVSLLGVTGGRPHFAQGQDHAGFSARVQAVAAISGVYDMPFGDTSDPWAPAAFMGSLPSIDPDRWAEASPINHVGPESAAFLFLHGTEDELTPFHQAELMMQRLHDAGVPAEIFLAEGGGHDFFYEWPWEDLSISTIEGFFRRILR